MTERTKLTLVALASAAMPDAYFTGARASDQANAIDEASGIDCAVVQNASGRLYDVWATSTERGKARLDKRVKAAQALEDVRGIAALGFGVEQVLCYQPAEDENGPTGDAAVAIMTHEPGHTRSLKLLTGEECSAVGTAMGAIHRIDPRALQERFYPSFTTTQIANQLKAWIANLKQAGHVPEEITDSWARIIRTEGLWSFHTTMVHGGFTDGDFLFSRSGLSAVHNWQSMQVNDPARDLAWTFAKLDQAGRDAVIAAYGRMMGSHLDDLIMLRANLWLQMEQVGDFIVALERADNEKIIRFKAQVEHLAQQLADQAPKPKAFTPEQRPYQTSRSSAQAAATREPEPQGNSSPTIAITPASKGESPVKQEAQAQQGAQPKQEPQTSQDRPSPAVDEDATVVRPAYQKAPGATGRHAAVRPPTLPDMTGSHHSGNFSAPEEQFDRPQRPVGRHSRVNMPAQTQPGSETNTQTATIDLASMRQLAQEQSAQSRQEQDSSSKQEPAVQNHRTHSDSSTTSEEKAPGPEPVKAEALSADAQPQTASKKPETGNRSQMPSSPTSNTSAQTIVIEKPTVSAEGSETQLVPPAEVRQSAWASADSASTGSQQGRGRSQAQALAGRSSDSIDDSANDSPGQQDHHQDSPSSERD